MVVICNSYLLLLCLSVQPIWHLIKRLRLGFPVPCQAGGDHNVPSAVQLSRHALLATSSQVINRVVPSSHNVAMSSELID